MNDILDKRLFQMVWDDARGFNELRVQLLSEENNMSDEDHIDDLVKIGTNQSSLISAQHVAASRLLRATGIHYPHDGCAITLSVMLQMAHIDVGDHYGALDLVHVLEKRGWTHVPLGHQEPGDVGTSCGDTPRHGIDHVYLVLKKVNDSGEMVIADNQATAPHFRWVQGHGKSPTTKFLRAPKGE